MQRNRKTNNENIRLIPRHEDYKYKQKQYNKYNINIRNNNEKMNLNIYFVGTDFIRSLTRNYLRSL